MKHALQKVIFGAIAMILSTSVWAQDIIVTIDARKIEAKISEVSKSEVRYKEFDNLNGPTFVIETREISSIIYSNGKVVVYNQTSESNQPTESVSPANEPVVDESTAEILFLSGKKVLAQLVEMKNDYIIYEVDGKMQRASASELDKVTLLKTGQVKQYSVSGSAKEESTTDKAIPLYVSRNGNTYYYNGRAMNEETYSNFLQNNCPEAYDIFNSGSNTAFAGWILFSVGVGLDVGSLISYLALGKTNTSTMSAISAMSWIGLGCEIACIPTLIVGYKKKHKSVDVYNTSRARKSTSKAYWSINASQYGIGIAYNF